MDVPSGKQPRRREGLELSRIVPPGTEVSNARKLLKEIASFRARDLPPEAELRLGSILEWNKSRAYKNLRKPELKLLRLIEMLLDKVSRSRSEKRRMGTLGKDPGMEKKSSSPQRETQKGHRAPDTTQNRKTPISDGILDVLAEARGVLSPRHLFNFLVQVRGRRSSTLEVASHFTSDTGALIDQLNAVVSAYFRSGRKGADEEHDVLLIRRLCGRLERRRDTSNGPVIKVEGGSVQRQASDQAAPKFGAERKASKSRNRKRISKRILRLASKVEGVLSPFLLCNFLEQARGRWRILQVASHFTTDIGALVDQLNGIVRLYIRSGGKSADEDYNILWIKGLCRRLKRDDEARCQGRGLASSRVGAGGQAIKSRSRNRPIGKRILRLASKVTGVLSPCLLCSFLEQAKGKWRMPEVASHFTTDIRALAIQLNEIVRLYFLSARKGPQEDYDIRWIKGLCAKLEQEG